MTETSFSGPFVHHRLLREPFQCLPLITLPALTSAGGKRRIHFDKNIHCCHPHNHFTHPPHFCLSFHLLLIEHGSFFFILSAKNYCKYFPLSEANRSGKTRPGHVLTATNSYELDSGPRCPDHDPQNRAFRHDSIATLKFEPVILVLRVVTNMFLGNCYLQCWLLF